MYYLKQQIVQFPDRSGCPAVDPEASLSAIVPVYAAKAGHVRSVIEALLQQDLPGIEVIVVKNGSFPLDLGPSAASAKIKVLELEKNVGAAHARNIGALHSRAEVLWLVDSDLSSIPQHCAAAGTRLLRENPDVGIIGSIVFQTANGDVLAVGRLRYDDLSPDDERLFDDDFANTACAFIRRDVFEAIGGFADFIEYPFDDVDFGFKLRAAGYRCCGARACAASHPLHSGDTTVFHEFMSFHNLLLHLAISYRPAALLHLLSKKAEQRFRMAPPRAESSMQKRAANMARSLCGLALGVGHLLLHAPQVLRHRRTRQAFIRGIQ